MDRDRLAKQILQWEPQGGETRMGRPPTSWSQTVSTDLKEMVLTYDEAIKRNGIHFYCPLHQMVTDQIDRQYLLRIDATLSDTFERGFIDELVYHYEQLRD
ncbi:unnamed protein product [Didymodactylos carnosus]|uniref:Uncharacterized protein n=1 Tax=Didymodactylos carnosus TaxID=1234261 RepID=A0A814Y9S7_9BILA|nr:unnamed protein product [Didymodactylos carnosus]CAF3990323.1 unnamed protein product [Didymodactylos carnosus]